MKIMRSHSFKSGIMLLLMFGFICTLAQPVDAARSHTEFTHWLQSLAKKSPSRAVKQQLADLKKSKADLDQLIMQASHMIEQNNQSFNLPSHRGRDDIMRILLLEWHQHRADGNSAATVPTIRAPKISAMPQSRMTGGDAFKNANLFTFHDGRLIGRDITDVAIVSTPAIVPLENNIAIGAP